MQRIERMKLSPNMANLNDYIRGQSNSVLATDAKRLGKNAGISPSGKARA